MTLYNTFFAGRRTGIITEDRTKAGAIAQARLKKRRGGDAVVVSRPLNTAEKKVFDTGKWVRTGPKGEPAGYKGKTKRGFGPKPKAYIERKKVVRVLGVKKGNPAV